MKLEIGDVGRAVSALRPSGVAEIRGVRHEVRSDGGWIDAGCPVVVIASDSFSVIVKLAEGFALQKLPDLGDKIPTPQERATQRHAHEERVREEDARAGFRERTRDALLIGAIFAVVAGPVGYWIGDLHGLVVAVAVTLILVVVLRIGLEIM